MVDHLKPEDRALIELKPCPFCGATLDAANWTDRFIAGFSFMRCSACGATGPASERTVTDAVAMWNSRAAREEGPRAHSDEPGDPDIIKHLLDEMDAEAMPNERRAEILALKIRRATPTEAAEMQNATPSDGGGDWVMVPRDLVALFAEVADWYDARESDTFEVWLDYPHGMISRKHAQLRNYRRMAEALAAAPKRDGGEPVAWRYRWMDAAYGEFADWDVHTNRDAAVALAGKHGEIEPLYTALSPTGGVKDREAVARAAWIFSCSSQTDFHADEEGWWAMAKRAATRETKEHVSRCYAFADAILALPPSAPGEA